MLERSSLGPVAVRLNHRDRSNGRPARGGDSARAGSSDSPGDGPEAWENEGGAPGAPDAGHHLRVLIANQRADRLALLARVVDGLGHEVIAREVDVSMVAAVTARERPDVALVGLGESREHALDLITEIVGQSFCPVIALLEAYDGHWVKEAAARGVFAYIVDSRPEELQSALDITLSRFAEYQQLQGAFDRRNAETLREAKRTRARLLQVLELHDGVMQALSVAHLALALDRRDESRSALLMALENTRTIVRKSVDDLTGEGVPLHELVRDSARTVT